MGDETRRTLQGHVHTDHCNGSKCPCYMEGLRLEYTAVMSKLSTTEAALAESRGRSDRQRREIERLATALEDIANRSTRCRIPGCVREFCEHYIAGISPHDFAVQVISEGSP